MTGLRLRIDFDGGGALGPGKIRLLEAVRDTGSISAAARALDMSYRRAWLLVDDLNRLFRDPVVAAATGGRHGGGAVLTPFGAALVDQFRAIEAEATAAVAARLAGLEATIAAPDPVAATARPRPPSLSRPGVGALNIEKPGAGDAGTE